MMYRILLPLVVLTAFFEGSPGVSAAAPTEYETKAGYLLNFVEFVEWPAEAFQDATSPVIVGVMGKDPFGAELEKLQDKLVNGRKLQIKRFKGALEFRGAEAPGRRQENLTLSQLKKLAELKSCHVLFISSSEKKYLPMVLKPLKTSCVVTVGETPAFVREGGIINFLNEGKRVQFEINLDAAGSARLKFSSKLLGLAKVIKSEHPDEKK
jgi:hypothetical protein